MKDVITHIERIKAAYDQFTGVQRIKFAYGSGWMMPDPFAQPINHCQDIEASNGLIFPKTGFVIGPEINAKGSAEQFFHNLIHNVVSDLFIALHEGWKSKFNKKERDPNIEELGYLIQQTRHAFGHAGLQPRWGLDNKGNKKTLKPVSFHIPHLICSQLLSDYQGRQGLQIEIDLSKRVGQHISYSEKELNFARIALVTHYLMYLLYSSHP